MLASNLRTCRTAAGLTQAQLARRIGVIQQALSAWENGHSEPSVRNLVAAARALDVSVDRLVQGYEIPLVKGGDTS